MEAEKKWREDPTSLCLDDQIGCGTAAYVDDLRRGTPLAGALRDTALERERAASTCIAT